MSAADLDLWRPERERYQRRALVAAAGGAAAFVVFGFLFYLMAGTPRPKQLLLSYLVAFTFWLGVGLGCLVLLMLQYLTGGRWGLALRRILESGARTLILLAVFFVPIALGVPWLYIWADPAAVAADSDLQHQRVYLNAPFFAIRAVLYFLIWFMLAAILNRWSLRQDLDPRTDRRFRLVSGPGIVLYGLTVTLASVDWVMSLEPHWYSTMYPVLYATSQLLTGMAFAIAILLLFGSRPPLSAFLDRSQLRDLGSLLLAFVMFWAYMSFSQFLLIWAGDLPEELPYYIRRVRGGWQVVAIVIIVLHFALPFLLLLWRDVKEKPGRLAAVASGLLVMRVIDVFWWIEPSYNPEPWRPFWLLDLAAVVALGGVWVWWFLWQLGKRPLLPSFDPEAEEVRS